MPTSLLTQEASQELAQGILNLAEELALQMMEQKQKRWLMQKEVFEAYDCDFKTLRNWEELGLKKRRQGTKWMYDRKDIDDLLQTLKE